MLITIDDRSKIKSKVGTLIIAFLLKKKSILTRNNTYINGINGNMHIFLSWIFQRAAYFVCIIYMTAISYGVITKFCGRNKRQIMCENGGVIQFGLGF